MFHRHRLCGFLIVGLLFCGQIWAQQNDKAAPSHPLANGANKVSVSQEASQANDETLKIAKEDLQAQKEQAKYARYLVVIGTITAIFLIYQLSLLRSQVKGARAEFNATHRPRIIVRRVSLNNARGVAVPDILGAEFIVANIGDTPTKIIEVNARLWLTEPNENLPAVPPYGVSNFPDLHVVPGESAPLTHLESAEVSNEANFRDGFLSISMHRGRTADSGMFLLGYVVYEDGNKVKRRTAFLREYRFDVRRFEPINHPDYEYQD